MLFTSAVMTPSYANQRGQKLMWRWCVHMQRRCRFLCSFPWAPAKSDRRRYVQPHVSVPSLAVEVVSSKRQWLYRQLADFLGRPGLIRRDVIHPALDGAALMSRNLTSLLEIQNHDDPELRPGSRVVVLHTSLHLHYCCHPLNTP